MRTRLLIASLLFLSGLVVSAYALPLLGQQVLKAPPHTPPSVLLLCSGPSLVNVTDPNPLLDGANGTAVFGCGFTSTGVSPAITVVRPGIVQAVFSLPAGVSIFLLPNLGSSSPMSQSQCAAGILLTSAQNATIPTGSYSYCESFPDPTILVPVTVNWYQA